jgi:hypothetical protein
MRLTPLLILALAGTANAQVIWTWLATVDEPVIDPDGVTTQRVTLSALMEAPAPTVYLAATIFDTLGAINAEYGHITDWQVLNNLADLTGDLTTSDGVSLYNTNAGQLCLWGPCTHANPIDVFEFTWQLNDAVDLDAPIDVMYVTDTAAALVKAGTDHDDAEVYEANVINEAVITWTIVPAPGVWCMGAGAAVWLAPRRRRTSVQERTPT